MVVSPRSSSKEVCFLVIIVIVTMVIKAVIMMTVQRHPRPRVDQSGHGDVHHEGAAHPPQDVQAHQPGDRHLCHYDYDDEYRLQLITTFPSVRLLHITRDEPRRIRVLTHYGSGEYLHLHRFCDCLISEIGQLVVISNVVTIDWTIQRQFYQRKSKCHSSVSIFCRHHQNISLTINIFCPALEEKPSKEPDHTWPLQVVITDGESMVVDTIITIMIIAFLTIITITIIIDN